MHGITAPSRLANAVRLFARARVSAASSGQWRARDWRRHGHRSQPGIDGASWSSRTSPRLELREAHPRCGCRAGRPKAFGNTATSYIIKASYEGVGGLAVDGQVTIRRSGTAHL